MESKSEDMIPRKKERHHTGKTLAYEAATTKTLFTLHRSTTQWPEIRAVDSDSNSDMKPHILNYGNCNDVALQLKKVEATL